MKINFNWKNTLLKLKVLIKKEWKVKLIMSIVVVFLIMMSSILRSAVKDDLFGKEQIKVTSSLFLAFKTNKGVSFGLLSNNEDIAIFIQVLITLIPLTASLFEHRKEYLFGYLLIGAGGLSNLIDRIDVGFIIDYISFDGSVYFNIADTYVIIGIVFIIYALFISEEDEEEKKIKKLGWRKKKDLIKK